MASRFVSADMNIPQAVLSQTHHAITIGTSHLGDTMLSANTADPGLPSTESTYFLPKAFIDC